MTHEAVAMASLRFQRGLFLLPIVSFCFLVLSLIATYVVAAGLGHVEFNFPYISYTGLKVPERGIFGQLLNMGAILLALNVYARYLRLNDYQTDVSRLNTACLVLGMISSFGQTMVANFETKVMRGPHYVGAGLAFGIGGIYCWLQALISWRVRRESRMPYHRVFWSQLAVSIAITVFAVTFGVSKAVYKSYDNEEELKKIDGPVRSAYLTSTVTEWLLAISIMFYLLTYVPEFRQVTVTGPCICRDRRDEAVSESRDKLDADSHPMVTSNGKFTSAA